MTTHPLTLRQLAAATAVACLAVAAAPRAGAADVSPACAAIARAVSDRMGPQARMTSCELDGTDADATRWIVATPDTAARIGEWSWFSLSGDRVATRVKALIAVDAPHVRSAQALGRGRTLGASDLVDDLGSVRGARFAKLPLAAEAEGARLTRPVGAADVIESVDIVQPPLIKAGERVVAVVRIGAVEVTAAMTAMDAGSVGDEIRIAQPDRKRVLRGRVVAPGRVEVAYEG